MDKHLKKYVEFEKGLLTDEKALELFKGINFYTLAEMRKGYIKKSYNEETPFIRLEDVKLIIQKTRKDLFKEIYKLKQCDSWTFLWREIEKLKERDK